MIFFSTLKVTLISQSEELINFDKSVIWLSLFNWIPILFAFFGFKIYLVNEIQKKLFLKIFIAGSFPVFLSCFLQKFFAVYGPLKTLFGSIVWFNKPLTITDPNYVGGLTGLFSNPNYLATWLIVLIPFLMALLKDEVGINLKKLLLYLLNFAAIYFALITNSRNALIGIIVSFLLMFSFKKNIKIYLFSGGLVFFTILLPILIDISNQNFMEPGKYDLIKKFINTGPFLGLHRINIYNETLKLILQKPLFGWGGGTYSFIIADKSHDLWLWALDSAQHTHNIILEMAYNFGIPSALIITITILKMFFIAFKKVFISKYSHLSNSLNKSWLTALTVFLLAHLSDITYYDGKISIVFCILLSGVSNLVSDAKEKVNI